METLTKTKKLTKVEKIHKEIDTAQDRLITEAIKIMSENSLDTNVLSKAERLENLGFIRSVDVTDTRSIQKVGNMGKKRAELVNGYKEKYPSLKFITEEEFDRICKKYGLIHAPVRHYLKSIPIENLKEIETAPVLQNEHYPDNTYLLTYVKGTKIYGLFPWQLNFLYNNGVPTTSRGGDGAPIVSKYFKRRVKIPQDWSNNRNYSTVDRSGLFIAAPSSHFDKSGLKRQKRGFFEVIKPAPKDPIVFRYCKEGIQVITKWGDEANDPALAL